MKNNKLWKIIYNKLMENYFILVVNLITKIFILKKCNLSCKVVLLIFSFTINR